MTSTNQETRRTVVAYFTSEPQAENAVRALEAADFSRQQIGIALSRRQSSAGEALASSGETGARTKRSSRGSEIGTKKEGAWEKLKDFFGVDSGVEPYADEEELNPTAAHEITDDDYEYGHEDVSHSLAGMSISEEQSRYFSHRLDSSAGAVVTVTTDDRAGEAEQILQAEGGDLGAQRTGYDYSSQPQGLQRIQLLGEVLRVHRDRVQRGEVRVRKDVVTEQQTVQVPVTREELVVERVPVSGQEASTAGEIGAENEIRIPLAEERTSLNKQTVVREQVNVGKRAVEEVENLEGSVRHEELDVKDESKTR